MKQYYEFKCANMDKIVFFRLGDFYEMFFDDAVIASQVLGLTLTGKDCGLNERAPMCGVPHHACDEYIQKLVESGYKVVICEQMEDPALAKGIVKRDVVKIVTRGTLTEGALLDEGSNNWLASVYYTRLPSGGNAVYICFADMSTGEARLCSAEGKDIESGIIEKLSRFSPVEIICQKSFGSFLNVAKFIKNTLRCSVETLDDREFDPCCRQEDILGLFSVKSISELGLSSEDPALCAVAAVCGYIHDTQKALVGSFSCLRLSDDGQVMRLGYAARTNLELTKSLRSNEKWGTLLWVLDKTNNALGRRALVNVIQQPLVNPYRIINRLDAVEELYSSGSELGILCDILGGVYDLERLMTKVLYKTAKSSDLRALSSAAMCMPRIKEKLSQFNSKLLTELNEAICPLTEISDIIEAAISDDQDTKDGVIKPGYSEELDSLKSIRSGANGIIDGIVGRERERTGIRNLKVGYNRVFGYYLEVTRSFYDLVPQDYVRKQTLVNCERFVTEELKRVEEQIITAEEKIEELETKLFNEVRDFAASKKDEVHKTAEAVAMLDVLTSFAKVALANDYVKPEIAIDGIINIRNGRHPVVEQTIENEIFVPNDTYLDLSSNRLAIITGPNMSGKSTYMRQTALITLMAQIGSFVPADYAKISVVDQIFTRVGASDDLAAGQSTFMVEMAEVAEIVKYATKNSLVILDEVGRGTSTFDGISIARSVAEYIADPKLIGCKTLFATHYHELISLEGEVPGVLNYSVAVRKTGDSVRFLRKIVRGGADESYGIEVAKLAGLPKKLIDRAKTILGMLEAEKPARDEGNSDAQITFDRIVEGEAIDRLKKTNIDELSDSELRELIEDIVKYI